MAPLKHSVLDVENAVSLNRHWRKDMIFDYKYDQKLLDLLAAKDKVLRPTYMGNKIMKGLNLDAIGNEIVFTQKMRVGHSFELLDPMVSSGLALKKYKPLLLSLLGEFKYERFDHIEDILKKVDNSQDDLASIGRYCLLEKEALERRTGNKGNSLLCRGDGHLKS